MTDWGYVSLTRDDTQGGHISPTNVLPVIASRNYGLPRALMANLVSGAAAHFFARERAQFREGFVDPDAIHVPVRHHADGKRRGVLGPDAFGMQRVAQFHRVHAACRAIKNHDVAFHA